MRKRDRETGETDRQRIREIERRDRPTERENEEER